MERVTFVQLGQITPAGRDLIDYMEQRISESVQLYESSGDLNHLNGMTGALKHYYVNVQQAGVMDAREWLESYDYGATAMYQNLLDERKRAEDEQRSQEQADKTTDMEQRLAALEAKLTEALAEVKAKDERITALESETEAKPEETEPPSPTRRRKKTKDAEQGDPAAESGAEEDSEEAKTD